MNKRRDDEATILGLQKANSELLEQQLDAESTIVNLRQQISDTNPRNPRHFDGIKGGRKRVPDTFTHKNNGSCM